MVLKILIIYYFSYNMYKYMHTFNMFFFLNELLKYITNSNFFLTTF